MNMNDFSAMNHSRCLRWHPKGLQSWSASDWLIACLGELGEAANVVKKMNRIRDGLIGNRGADQDPEVLRAKLADELADTFIYLDLVATAQGINLAEVVRAKFNRTSNEFNFPEVV